MLPGGDKNTHGGWRQREEGPGLVSPHQVTRQIMIKGTKQEVKVMLCARMNPGALTNQEVGGKIHGPEDE